ncbi:copia protein [Tanacetum coccineum]
MTIIGTKWMYRNKLDEKGVVSRNKARLAAQCYNQQEGIDYDETYAPVARLESIRILLAYDCALDFKLFQMDIKSAFLNGFINEEVYVTQPLGFIDFEKPEHVYKLKKALNGLKQAPKVWFDVFFRDQLLVFQQHQDESLYDSWTPKGDLRKFSDIGAWYLGASHGIHTARDLPGRSRKDFRNPIELEPLNETELKEVGLNCNHNTPFSSREVPSFDGPEPQPLLNSPSLDVSLGDVIGPEPPIKPHSPDSSRMKGLESKEVSPLGEELSLFDRPNKVERGRKAHLLEDKQISSVGVFDEVSFYTLLREVLYDERINNKLTKDEECESVDSTKYQGMIGSLLYLTASRPDIMFSVCLCARFQEDPKTSHLEAVKRDSVDRKSTSGICTFIGCCLTSWFSKKQTALAISMTKAEYVSAGKACQQALWMNQSLINYDIRLDDVLIMCANKGAIDLSKNPVQHSWTKQIEIRHHFLWDNVQKGHISIKKVSSVDNIADILTKPLKRESFNYLRRGLGMMEHIP